MLCFLYPAAAAPRRHAAPCCGGTAQQLLTYSHVPFLPPSFCHWPYAFTCIQKACIVEASESS